MINESNKIIVKVGNKSNIRLSNSKVYRAITANDLVKLTGKYDDCQIVIIESISEDEQDAVREFAKSFNDSRDSNTVLFYIPSDDDITSGIADELDYNIYLTDRDLYKHIYDTFGINVSVYLDDRKALNSKEISEYIPEGITDIFGGIGDDTYSDISDTIAAIDKADETMEQTEVSVDSTPEEEVNVETHEEAGSNEPNTTINTEMTSSIADDIPDGKGSTNDEYIEELKMKLSDAKYDYNVILKDMKEANGRIISLEDIIRILREEKEVMEKRFNELMISEEVLEDPISLSEYSVIKNNVEQLESQIVDLNSAIENLKQQLEEKELDINSNETTIEELRENINSLKEQLETANKSIESGEAFKEQIEEYEDKIRDLLEDKAKSSSRIEALEEESTGLHESVDELAIRVEEESSSRLKLLEEMKLTITKIKELSDKLTTVENEKSELSNKLSDTQEQLNASKESQRSQLDTISKLEQSVNETDKRIEIANSSSNTELIKLRDLVAQLQTKLSIAEQKLQQSENQYKILIEKSGIDESGASALMETNRTLETISKTLREQLGATTKELEVTKRKEVEALKQANTYKAQVASLQKNLQSIASAGGGAISGSLGIRPIQLNTSQSQIISVFGSGSFGITTTAMSLAHRLSTTSSVLYVDFDLVSPMADSWFKINPMIAGIPGTVNGNIQNSGLGIFIEHGVDLIAKNMNKVIVKASSTKGGGLHYLSGLYYHPDAIKLATADYEAMFKLLASNFQYIVIDFGRFGSSEINDQLIKAISNIAFRNIVVTTANPFEVRNFKTKLTSMEMNLSNIAWLFNMCTTTAIEQKVKDLVSPCKFDLLPKMEQYGSQEQFLRNSITRDRFGLFVDKTVFGR